MQNTRDDMPSVLPAMQNEEREHALSALLDLSPQQRNLLLMRPLFQLEFSKNKFEGDGERPLFEGIDTHYLCLAALACMMEGTAIASGYTPGEVRQFLAEAVGNMRPALGPAQRVRVADIVLDALDNAAEKYQEHSCTYFHAPSGETRALRFRLAVCEPDLEDIYRYRPTEQGYLLLMGMLDLEVEDYQILMERMLQLLIEQGRYNQAYDFACRARMLSIEHRQRLQEFMQQAWRAPNTVRWERDIGPRLADARVHIEERQKEDRRMEESVHAQLLQAEAPSTREQLARLGQVLRSAGIMRVQLLTDVSGAGDRFMSAQTMAFRSRKPSGLPDPEERLLPMALQCRAEHLVPHVEELLLSLYPPVAPKIMDLSDLFALLQERRAVDAAPEEGDDGEVIPFVPHPDPFPPEVTARVQTWLETRFAEGKRRKLDELLAEGETEGLGRLERQAVVYALYRSFPESESTFPGIRAAADGMFSSDVAQGDNLRFDPVEDDRNPREVP